MDKTKSLSICISNVISLGTYKKHSSKTKLEVLKSMAKKAAKAK